MERSHKTDITLALVRLGPGKARRPDTDRFMELIYDDLRRIAASYLRGGRADHTLQPTAIVHEAYLKLVQLDAVDWKDRAQFMTVASQAMRHVLVDHARRRGAAKRGGGWKRVTLSSAVLATGDRDGLLEVLALDRAMELLAGENERVARVAEMRIFGGMTSAEIAVVEQLTDRTIRTDWAMARMWLARQLELRRG